ncbi:MAG: L,D-transpeptidase [Nitrospirae bacterium]|nr:L,D-transpeptidase [Nitrospirota bacterium]
MGTKYLTNCYLLVLIPYFLFLFHEISSAKTLNLCRISYPSDSKIEWKCYKFGKGQTLEKLFKGKWGDIARFNRIDSPVPSFYPPAEKEEKYILINLSEQYLGAYENGGLVFSMPVATGRPGYETPSGDFRITAAHKNHVSNRYKIENTDTPYPMYYGLKFHQSRSGTGYYIHGRDVPGYPASHGCIGLYGESMQKKFYNEPKNPELDDIEILFRWAVGAEKADNRYYNINNGPVVRITGRTPVIPGLKKPAGITDVHKEKMVGP